MSSLLLEQEKDKVVKDFLLKIQSQLKTHLKRDEAFYISPNSRIQVSQTKHGLQLGQQVYLNTNGFVTTTPSSKNCQAVGIVISIPNQNTVDIQMLEEARVQVEKIPIQTILQEVEDLLLTYE